MKKIQNNEDVLGVKKLTEDKLQSDPLLTKLFNLLKQFKDYNKQVFVWNPDPQYIQLEISPISLNCKFNKGWEIDLPKIWEKDYNYKVYNTQELKLTPANPCLTLNKNKNLAIYISQNKDPLKHAQILDIINGQQTDLNPDELVDIFTPIFTQDPKEAIVVVIDTSGSMLEEFSLNLTRMGAVKAFFNAFADRTIAYKLQHVISLIFFDSQVQIQCDFSEHFQIFKELINRATPRDNTCLFDALDQAVESLLTIKKRYPDVIPRIIALTDGEDNYSKFNSVSVVRKIIVNNIIIDSFVVGGDCDDLKSITLVSGGKCFFLETLVQGIKLFEMETILSSGIRKQPDMHNEINLDEIEQLLQDSKNKDFSMEDHEFQLPLNINKSVYNYVKTYEILNKPIVAYPSQRLKRIMFELAFLIKFPHNNYKVFVTDDITFWKVLLVGPIQTPYENGQFILYISFSENYPYVPPQIRFLTSIYHCNINQQGRICHPVLDRNYLVDTSVRQIFNCIYGLLLAPDPNESLDSIIASEYMTDFVSYQHKAMQLTKQKAMQSEEEILQEIFGCQDIFEGKELETKKQIVDWLKYTKNQNISK